MDTTQLHQMPNIPGTWQYWSEAPNGDLWLVAADDAATVYIHKRASSTADSTRFLRVTRRELQTTLEPDAEPLF